MIDKYEKHIFIFFLYCVIAYIAGFLTAKYDSNTFQDAWFSLTDTRNIEETLRVWKDQPEKLHDGVLLVTSQFMENPAALLIDVHGKVLHRWNIEAKLVNPTVMKLYGLHENDAEGKYHTLSDAALFPNGDLLAIHEFMGLENFRGQQIFKMDKNSHILWSLPGNFHHVFTVTSDGIIYALESKLVRDYPEIDFTKGKTDALFFDDLIRVISPEGKIINTMSVLKAFADTPYRSLLNHFKLDLPHQSVRVRQDLTLYDVIHTNGVQYVTASQAARMPFAKEGDLLLSFRGLDTIAILRPSISKIVWAMQGPWRHQHYVRSTEDGKIRLFDNEGGSVFRAVKYDEEWKSEVYTPIRVLELDPLTGLTTTLYFNPEGDYNSSYWRGYFHELPNGSFIVSSSQSGRVLQVSEEDGRTIWELRGVPDRSQKLVPYSKRLSSVKYYDKDYPVFLREIRDE